MRNLSSAIAREANQSLINGDCPASLAITLSDRFEAKSPASRSRATILFLTGWIILGGVYPVYPLDYEIRGYLRNTALTWKPASQDSSSEHFNHFLNHRLNLRWFLTPASTLGLDWKNRALYRSSATESVDSPWLLFQPAFFNWKREIIDKKRWLVTTEIDRAWIDYQSGSLQLTFGRQRIAWGTNLVWNPVDLFNPASPLDFDNEEKPGGDMVRLQYHLGVMTRLELVLEAQRDQPANWAGLLRGNWRDYDLYFIAGKQRGRPLAGLAWAGQVSGAGVRGECRVDLPFWNDDVDDNDRSQMGIMPDSIGNYNFGEDLDNQRAQMTIALSGDYTFANGFYIHTEVLANSEGTTAEAGGYHYLRAWQEGWLTPAKASWFGEVGKDLNPLLRAGAAGILNPYDHSFYLGPSIFWSALTNLDISVTGMFYGGARLSEFGGSSDVQMVKIKWSF